MESVLALPAEQNRERPRAAVAEWARWLHRTGAHGLWIGIWSLVAWGATAGAPFLVDAPVALMLLTPRAAFVLLAATELDMVWFVVLGTVRLSITDASWFIVGQRFPESAPKLRTVRTAQWWRLPARWSATACRWIAGRPLAAGAFLFLRPTGRYLGVAGATGVCPRLAAASSVGGTIAYLIAVHSGLDALF